mmetsp:Transcript_77171/g.174560  ORF Transcript_77171/g.174560 Transcript_77171/m.174560 type:complete len:365 (+) Transcript_77171:65-1159(+)
MAPMLAKFLGATGCLLPLPAVAGIDAGVALVQGALQVHQREVTEPELGNKQRVKWAPIKYNAGERLECQSKDGTWTPCQVSGSCPTFGQFNVHIADDFPGYDLQCFPSEFMRRKLSPGDSDFLIDNSQLQHKGPGLKYRFSKNLSHVGGEYAPWNSLVIGEQPEDGWIRVDRGYYLPIEVNGRTVVVQQDRKQSPLALEQALTSGPVPAFASGEHAEFRTASGDWFPCNVLYPGSRPHTYQIDVTPSTDLRAVYPVVDAHAQRMRKTMAPIRLEKKKEGSSICQKGSCLLLRMKRQSGTEFFVQVAKSAKVEDAMRTACRRMQKDWPTCQNEATFMHKGQALNPEAPMADSGLDDQVVITVDEV